MNKQTSKLNYTLISGLPLESLLARWSSVSINGLASTKASQSICFPFQWKLSKYATISCLSAANEMKGIRKTTC